jgi:hypothetical protein
VAAVVIMMALALVAALVVVVNETAVLAVLVILVALPHQKEMLEGLLAGFFLYPQVAEVVEPDQLAVVIVVVLVEEVV